MNVTKYTEADNLVLIEDELMDYIKDNFTPVTSDQLSRIIKTMDLFGYGDYSHDLYNFINLSKSNMDPDEEKLFFISLVVSHAIKLIEGIGLIVKDEIVNEDYFQYLEFFTLVLEALWLVKNMTNIDAIYFSDLINNDNLQNLEIIYRILQYYSRDIVYDTFFYLIEDYKESFFNTLKSKIEDLSVMDIEEDITEIEEDDLINLSRIINTLGSKYKQSLILSYLTISITDFKYLIKNKTFIKETTKTIIVQLDSFMKSDNPSNYYMFLDTNPDIINLIFDLFFINFLDNLVNENSEIEEALDYGFDIVKDVFYDREYKGASGLMKVLNGVRDHLTDLLDDLDFKESLIRFIKGSNDE